MDDVDRMNTTQQYDQAAGLAAVPVESEFTQAALNTAEAMTGAGINPNSGLFKAELEKVDRKKAEAKADNINQVQVGQQNRYVQGLQNIVKMGQGAEASAVQGMGALADMSGQRAYENARSNVMNRNANRQVAGQVIGAGTRYGLGAYEDSKGEG